MGLKIAVIAGGVFEAERSLAAANDVMAALKEAEHEHVFRALRGKHHRALPGLHLHPLML